MSTSSYTRMFGDYVLGDRLGKGGQGKVFYALHKDRMLEKPKALKVLLHNTIGTYIFIRIY